MLRHCVLFVLWILLWTACQAQPQLAARDVAVADAAWRSKTDDPPEVVAVDPVVGNLLRSAFAAHSAQRRVLLQNLANVATPAYKAQRVSLGTQAIDGFDGERCQVPVVLGIEPDLRPGVIEATGRAFDVAIDGNGWFAVVTHDGTTAYLRAGNLQIDCNGKLVDWRGFCLVPQVTVPSDLLDLSIDPEGRVGGVTAGNPDGHTLFGQLTLHRFVNPAGLRLDGDGLRHQTESSGPPITGAPGLNGLGALKQGFLERSNVDSAATLLELQILERQHEALVLVLRQFGMIAP